MSDLVRLLAERRGLSRALECFPDAVAAAAERGLRSPAPPPIGPLTEPAGIFDPSRLAGER